ncbi:MAG: nucleotidyltransferase [candidate division Zixibacteria bacterium]|jgi:predicted nucleotidyltransferase|nr:nucleotidyltransferase [candidate division Zixibacteria bacterium]
MKSQDGIREVLRKYKRTLKERFKVKEIGVFGSFARGEGLQDSDVDILVEFSEPIGWEFIDLKDFLGEILGREVDLVTVKALKPQLRDKILKEVVFA